MEIRTKHLKAIAEFATIDIFYQQALAACTSRIQLDYIAEEYIRIQEERSQAFNKAQRQFHTKLHEVYKQLTEEA